MAKNAHGYFHSTVTASELKNLILLDNNPSETKPSIIDEELKTVIAKFLHDANKPAQNFYMILASHEYRKNREKDDSKIVYQPTIDRLIDQLKTQIVENRASVQEFYHGFPFKDQRIVNTTCQRYLGQYDQLEEWLRQSDHSFDPAALSKTMGSLKELTQTNIEFADQIMAQIG